MHRRHCSRVHFGDGIRDDSAGSQRVPLLAGSSPLVHFEMKSWGPLQVTAGMASIVAATDTFEQVDYCVHL